MATCPYCAETVQAAAIKCRHCGSALTAQPQAKASTGSIVLTVALAGLGLLGSLAWRGGAGRSDAPQLNVELVAQKAVQARLRDPQSARFDGFRYVAGKAGCGSVNARNAVGGYPGPRRFIYVGAGSVVMEGDLSPLEFDLLWSRSC